MFNILYSLLFLTLAALAFALDCEQCIPFPGQNLCDITTSCIATTFISPVILYCACAAGFRANPGSVGIGPGPVEWRLPFLGQEYRVFVKPGVVCDTLCDDWFEGPNSCSAIAVKTTC